VLAQALLAGEETELVRKAIELERPATCRS